ncbi:MAG: CopG family transcriptional regulator [Hyphomicrobiales bacterium]|nr:CopG family transcriptional regulator [Hyphomicrobiales bacterium]
MADIHKLGARQPDSEKITINVGFVDLGGIDLLVKEGFYSNRSDFIRTAVRNQLQQHGEVIKQTVSRQQIELGLRRFGRAELEALRTAGERLDLQVLGLLVIAPDVPAELARATINSIHVLGAMQASPEVKDALKDRLR